MIGPFLVCGGLAAAINWGARIALSPWLGFELSVVAAYAIGMIAGFILYRRFVWPDSGISARDQAAPFIGVNAASAVVVFLISVGLAALGGWLFGRTPAIEALAHGAGIAAGAVANYIGHGKFTFARKT
jgi:energy-coupling factor transport system substrate-specific component